MSITWKDNIRHVLALIGCYEGEGELTHHLSESNWLVFNMVDETSYLQGSLYIRQFSVSFISTQQHGY